MRSKAFKMQQTLPHPELEKTLVGTSIINRRILNDTVTSLVKNKSPTSPEVRDNLLSLLSESLTEGRGKIRSHLESGQSGRYAVQANSHLLDQIIRVLFDFTVNWIFPNTNPTSGERLSLVAVGGYGRAELAPFSDIDLLFLLPYKQTPWGEQVIEFLLYMLWDLGLKVGHSTRSIDESIRLARNDLSTKTALLESRYLWGDQTLFIEMKKRFRQDVVASTGPDYVAAKLAERDDRHKLVGDSRYVLEPNVKEGKGGLRDLQTLFWIAKYLYHVDYVKELIEKRIITKQEYYLFFEAENFLHTLRCHLHYLAQRDENRLTFDRQPELATLLGYKDRAGARGVERFMKHYFLVAKDVGDLTRIFCSVIEEQHRRPKGIKIPNFGLFRRHIDGFPVDGNRINLTSVTELKQKPTTIIELFYVAHQHDLDIHPNALKLITRNQNLINNSLRNDSDANRLFLEILTSTKDPEIILRRLNESGVFGRFIPDFGRVVAQMQHDMYHVYTVDEHTIRAIGILAKIESGLFAEDHPLSAEIIKKVELRRALYAAVFLHDIAKGRGGDHSILGEEITLNVCPRLGLNNLETQTAAWLVRWHLAMSSTAFKRDLDDPKTIGDFVELVQSPERLRLLLILTVADIRAVGPNVWNGWKGQLLRDLYYKAEEFMLGGKETFDNKRRAASIQDSLRKCLSDWEQNEIERHLNRGNASFWLSADIETHERWAKLMRKGDQEKSLIEIEAQVHDFQSVTEITVYTGDHPGLFSRLAGAFSVSGASIVDARIFTTTDGMALDVFWIQDARGSPIAHPTQLIRLKERICDTLLGHIHLSKKLPEKDGHLPDRARGVFTVEPIVIVDNDASDTHTVIEVNSQDRPALLHDLTRGFFELSLSISHARISTYGERVVDVFYVKDMFGLKIINKRRIEKIRTRLLQALGNTLNTPNQEIPRSQMSDAIKRNHI